MAKQNPKTWKTILGIVLVVIENIILLLNADSINSLM